MFISTETGPSWFTHNFDVTAGDVIDLDLEWTGGGQTNIFLYDETGALLDRDNTTAPSPKGLDWTATSTGSYRIGIKIKTGTADYTATIDLNP